MYSSNPDHSIIYSVSDEIQFWNWVLSNYICINFQPWWRSTLESHFLSCQVSDWVLNNSCHCNQLILGSDLTFSVILLISLKVSNFLSMNNNQIKNVLLTWIILPKFRKSFLCWSLFVKLINYLVMNFTIGSCGF